MNAEIQDKSSKNSWESAKNEINKFSYKIDGRWTHFLWHNFKKNNSIDDAHMNFITTIVMAKLSTGQILKGAERIECLVSNLSRSLKISPPSDTKRTMLSLSKCLQIPVL